MTEQAVIKLGAVCHSKTGGKTFTYVYVGYTVSTTGTRSHYFVTLTGHLTGMWTYRAVEPETLRRKFPDLVMEVVDVDFSAACET